MKYFKKLNRYNNHWNIFILKYKSEQYRFVFLDIYSIEKREGKQHLTLKSVQELSFPLCLKMLMLFLDKKVQIWVKGSGYTNQTLSMKSTTRPLLNSAALTQHLASKAMHTLPTMWAEGVKGLATPRPGGGPDPSLSCPLPVFLPGHPRLHLHILCSLCQISRVIIF